MALVGVCSAATGPCSAAGPEVFCGGMKYGIIGEK